ncbi:MAG: metal-dependent hydrolase [Candidatus Portnoybacteria bacterium]|nr:metal-dependent hydrolase [Candidatus Portnoybacteria bacterium]
MRGLRLRILRLIAAFFVALLDLSMGAAIFFLAAKITGHNISVLGYIFGALLAVAPDIDLLSYLKKEHGRHHDQLIHRPAFAIPAGVFIGWIAGGPFWACVAGLCLFVHFLHDTQTGIAWLWPFSLEYKSLPFLKIEWQIIEKYAGKGIAPYLDDFWLEPTKHSFWQLVPAVIILTLLVWLHFGSPYGLYIALAFFIFSWIALLQFWQFGSVAIRESLRAGRGKRKI